MKLLFKKYLIWERIWHYTRPSSAALVCYLDSISFCFFHLTNISGLHSRKLPEFLEKRTSAQAMPSLRTVLSRNVFSISFSSHNFQNFWLCGLLFGNFLLFRFSGNFPRNILTTTLKFQAWKVPLLSLQSVSVISNKYSCVHSLWLRYKAIPNI